MTLFELKFKILFYDFNENMRFFKLIPIIDGKVRSPPQIGSSDFLQVHISSAHPDEHA